MSTKRKMRKICNLSDMKAEIQPSTKYVHQEEK